MPYHVEKDGNKYKVVKDSDGKVLGTHTSRKDANAQLAALYASEKKK